MVQKKALIKVLCVSALCALSLFTFFACSKESGAEKAKDNKAPRMLRVGILQLVEHDALDASYKGFVDALERISPSIIKTLKASRQTAKPSPKNL